MSWLFSVKAEVKISIFLAILYCIIVICTKVAYLSGSCLQGLITIWIICICIAIASGDF